MNFLSLAARAAPSPIAPDASSGEEAADAPSGREAVARLLAGVEAHSPFLRDLVRRDPERLRRILDADPDDDLTTLLGETRAACAAAADDAAVRRILRQARAHVALLVALADLASVWDVVAVTRALTRAADCFVSCAVDHLVRGAARAGRIAINENDPGASSGLVVLGLGKLGAHELNYSSDIDLVVVYDAASARLAPNVEPSMFYVRLTQSLARLLSDRTEDGYVARVDLRLRPDPGSTPVAVSIGAALAYYETLGQNWERAAFIKARPVAGSMALGAAFLKELEPFVWRRYFDYAAIADIHAMKRQIHAVRGFFEIVVPGHDVKLGRGGIREIEFFVQTQQLIFGGRRPHMRGRRTLDMLAALADDGWVTPDARDELSRAYRALRTVEHRLQMIADEQTQRLPSDPPSLARFALFCGHASTAEFVAWITAHFRAVERHYARLFEHAPGLDAGDRDLVFTGADDDPGTIETLRDLGYRDPSRVSETIRGWHFGRRPAVRTARAREVLTELVPGLLQSFAKCGDPDAAIAAFDAALARMPAATELFSILKASAPLRVLVGDILGAAPRLAAAVVATPHVLDGIVAPTSLQGGDVWIAEAKGLAALDATEDFLDRLRRLARETQFLIGVRVLTRMVEPHEAGPLFSDLAGALVEAALAHVRRAFEREHGRIEGADVAVVGLGKLGSREMSASSDLDLMVVFRAGEETSDGPRPLAAGLYFTRLTQRLIAALTAPTREGRLYDIDMRLRPWGTQGPLAVRLEAFAAYQEKEAETWERLALTRARVLAGDAPLCATVERAIRAALSAPRDRAALARDVAAMRETIARAKGDRDRGDLKLYRGGLLDVEFLAQFLVLAHAGAEAALLTPSTGQALTAARATGVLDDGDGAALIEAHRLFTDVTQMRRLVARSAGETAAAARLIAACAGFPDAAALDAAVDDAASRVRAIAATILGAEPAC